MKLNGTSVLQTVFLDSTAVGCFNDTRTNKHAHEPTRKSAVRGCLKGKSLTRGCCTVEAWLLYPGCVAFDGCCIIVLQNQQQRCEKRRK